jgi:hypothetical protein
VANTWCWLLAYNRDLKKDISKQEWAFKGVQNINVVEERIKLRDIGWTEEQINTEIDRKITKTREKKEKQYDALLSYGDIVDVYPDKKPNGAPYLGEYAHANGIFVVIHANVGSRTMTMCKQWALPEMDGEEPALNRKYAVDLKKLIKDFPRIEDNKVCELPLENALDDYLVEKVKNDSFIRRPK